MFEPKVNCNQHKKVVQVICVHPNCQQNLLCSECLKIPIESHQHIQIKFKEFLLDLYEYSMSQHNNDKLLNIKTLHYIENETKMNRIEKEKDRIFEQHKMQVLTKKIIQ